MKRFCVLSTLAAILSMTASPAFSFPDLVSNWTSAGWSYPALPRSTPDATGPSTPLAPAALPGNSFSTYWNATVKNQSGENTGGPFSHGMFLDDVLQATNFSSFLLPNGLAFYLNHASPAPIKGGRHTMLSRADLYGNIPESNEFNNDWTRQYIWSGLPLNLNAPVTRSGDPYVVSTGFGPYYNNEGFQGTTGFVNYWNVFAVMPQDVSGDFDIKLCTETPLNVPQQGFGYWVAASYLSGSPYTDFVVIDRNVAPSGTYYAAVENYGLTTTNKVVEFDVDQGLLANPGESIIYSLDPGEIVDMHEVYLNSNERTRIQIRRLSGDSDVIVELYNPSTGFGARTFDAVASASSVGLGPGNDVFVNVTAPVSDYYGIVVAKPGPQSLAKSLQYSVVVSPLPNLTRYTPAGWYGPVVPRTTNDSNMSFAPLSPTLPGNSTNTWINFTTINQGPGPMLTSFLTRFYSDDVGIVDGISAGMSEGECLAWYNVPMSVYGWLFTGGLHHLRTHADILDSVVEFPEYDNDFTDWFVWTPLELANQVPVVRTTPPAQFPVGWGPYPSCDGFRSPGFQGSYWTAIAMIPTSMSDDYDVRLHPASTGSKDGFGSSLAWSADIFPGRPDFCIINYNVLPGVPIDASVTNWGGSSDFYMQRADAPYWGYFPSGFSRIGPLTLDAHDCLDIHEFYFDAGVPYYLSVNNLGGNADLEMFLYDGAGGYHVKWSSMANMNANGPGGDEHMGPITFTNGGFYAVAVSKTQATEVNKSATYELVLSTGQSVVDAPVAAAAPTAFALSAPRPNPFAGSATIELAVPQGHGKAVVAVYDLQGRRIAELANESTPGRHTLSWDGRDSTGREAAAGVYFVRLEAAGVAETKKITLLR